MKCNLYIVDSIELKKKKSSVLVPAIKIWLYNSDSKLSKFSAIGRKL